MEKTLLFYDLETSGLNMCFDQPLEFAAVRTDWDLNELERTHFHIRLRGDVIPSPEAVLVTGFDALNQPGDALSELEAALIIHELFNTPMTISIGYNSLSFDDEFLRFMFYRNLLPPYKHQFNNGCGRADLFPIAVIFYLFHNDVMRWRTSERDDVSLKLENLGNLNGFFAGAAHSALYDTLASLQMARLFKAKQPKTWQYLLDRFNKDRDREELEKIQRETLAGQPTLAYAVDTRYGYQNNCIGMVADIGPSKVYKNQNLWLRLDSENLKETTPKNLTETSMVIRKRLGDIPFILPLYPRYSTRIEPERSQLERSNLEWLISNPDLFAEICEYHRNFRYPEAQKVDADAMLYINGFTSKADEQCCRKFHEAPPSDKSALLDNLESDTLREMGFRTLGRHFNEALAPHEKAAFDNYLAMVNALEASPPNDYKNRPCLTLNEALNTIAKLLPQPDITLEKRKLLENLAKYLHQRVKT